MSLNRVVLNARHVGAPLMRTMSTGGRKVWMHPHKPGEQPLTRDQRRAARIDAKEIHRKKQLAKQRADGASDGLKFGLLVGYILFSPFSWWFM